MTTIPYITAVYAGLLGLMLVALSWRIMRMRAKLEVISGSVYCPRGKMGDARWYFFKS